MKAYEKPVCDCRMVIRENLAALQTWLAQNELEGAGITTYEVNS